MCLMLSVEMYTDYLADYMARNEKTEERRPTSDIQWLHCAKETILGIVSKYSYNILSFHHISYLFFGVRHGNSPSFPFTKASSFSLANVAQTSQSQIEDKERIHSKGNPVFDNTRAAQDADTRCQ